MILSNVNIGTGPSAGDGDPLRSAFTIINNNFQIIENNVNALTNSVTSVAGRTGNVILTVNDIVGLSNAYAISSATTTANTGMKGYVDQANTIQSGQVNAANLAIIAANLGMKGYVDSVAGSGSNYSNVNVKAYTETMGFQNFSNVNVAAYVTTANSAIIGYIDQANTIQSAQVNAANLAIIAANLGMKGYVDSVAGQSIYGNANVASYLPTYGGNIDISGITHGGNAIHVYNTLHIQGDSGGNGLFVGDPDVEFSPYGNSIASFHGNVNAPVYLNVHNINNGAESLAGIALTSDVGDTVQDSLILAVASSGYDSLFWPNLQPLDSVIDSTEGNLWIGTALKTINFYVKNSTEQIPLVSIDTVPNQYRGNLNIHEYTDLRFLTPNSKIRFGDGSIQTTAYTGYGNVQVGVFANLSNYAYNANVTAANLGMKGYVDSVASQSIYGNGNVKSYLTQFDGNIIPSANVTYSLGNVTHRWKDLYISGNTIFLGDTTITTSGGAVLTPVTRQLFSQSFLPGSTNSAATFTLDRLPTAGSTRTVVVIGEQGISPPSPAPSYTLTEGVDFTISGLSLIITASYTATNISCTESYSDTGDLITATEVATDTITPGSGDLTVSGNVTVDGDLYVSPTSIYMGNLRISAADGNLKVNTGIKFSDDSVQSTAYSNVKVAAYLAGNITVGNIAGSVDGYSIGYRDVPQITVANLTLIASDAGKHYYGANTNPTTITIPTNANVAFGNGTAISIVNQGTGNITVANAAGVLLYLAGNNTAGSRTLTSYGMATLIKVQVNTWFINGTGVV